MGSQDKGLLIYRKRPLIEFAVDLAKPHCDELVISCNRNLDIYRQYCKTVVMDRFPDYQGPLAGIAAAAPLCKQPLLFVCPCDMPALPANIVDRLYAQLSPSSNIDVVVCHDGVRRQPLVMLLKKNSALSIPAYLATGERRVDQWQNQQKLLEVNISDATNAFDNINNLQQLADQ